MRLAMREFINSERKKIPIAKILDQIAKGEMPDYLRDNNLDFRNKKDIAHLERLLKQEVE